MTLDEVAAFIAVQRLGGVARAAASLGRSQPAISRRLEQLELALGCLLMERSPSAGYAGLTEAGRAFLPHAEAMLAAAQDARRAVEEIDRVDGGEVTLAVVGTLATDGLSDLIRQFASESPRARLRLLTATSASVSALVRSGQATMGMRYGNEADPQLDSLPAGSEELVAVMSPRLKAHFHTDGRASALASFDWIGFPADTNAGSFGVTLLELLAANKLDGGKVNHVDSLNAQLCLVEAGLGLALLPMTYVEEALKRKSLVLVPGRLRATIPITLVHRRGGYLSAAARRLRNLVERRRDA